MRNTAASSCMAFCICSLRAAVGVEPEALRRRSKRSRWPSVQAGLASGWEAPALISSPAFSAAARPNTTRSVRELEPRRLAPCTETQAASPTAISPGMARSGSSPCLVSTSPW